MTKEEIKNKYFYEDEEIIWSGKPENLKLFSKYDIFLIPITVIFAAFILVYVFSAFMLMIEGKSAAFALSGITCLLVAFYLVSGRIWYRNKRLSKNLYFVTNKRVFVFNTLRNTVSCDIPLEHSDAYVKGNDLVLAEKNPLGDIACALGLDLFLYNIIHETPAFYSVENPSGVLKIVESAKRNRKADKNDSNFI